MRVISQQNRTKQYLSEFFTSVPGEPISYKKMTAAGLIRMLAATPTIFLLTLMTLITYKKTAYRQDVSQTILLIWLFLFVAYIVLNILIASGKLGGITRALTYACIVIEVSTNQLILYSTGSLTSHAVIFLVVLVCIYRVFFDYRLSLFAAAAGCVLYALTAFLEVGRIIPLTPYLPAPLAHIAYTDPSASLAIIAAVVFGVLITFFITNFSMNQIMKLNRYILENLKEEKIKATTDALTGLYNRRSFDEQLQRTVEDALRRSRPLALMMIDIDDFKKYNDTYGHQAGDAILTAVAGVIAGSVRTQDVAARFGGEEFVVILEEANAREAAQIAERIRGSIESLPAGRVKSRVTVSIGISTLPEDGKDAETLIKRADDSLYYSKQHGKNRVIYARQRT